MMQRTKACVNMNHSRLNTPVHFCATCGEVVNKNIPVQICAKEKHDRSRIERTKYCSDCGEQLVMGRW